MLLDSIPWTVVLVIGSISLLGLALMVFGYQVAEQWRMLPPLFVPQKVQIVHYDLVQLPVEVGVQRTLFHLLQLLERQC